MNTHDMPRMHGSLRILPETTPLAIVHWAWRQLTSQERLEFLTEMLTPNERRALMLGLDDTEE